MELNGNFQIVDWQEKVEQEFGEEAKLSNALVKQTYTGDIVGSSQISYRLYYTNSANAFFNGFEIITCDHKDEPFSLTLQHDGKFKNGIASSQFTVIDCQHNKDLIGKTGNFTSLDEGKARYRIL